MTMTFADRADQLCDKLREIEHQAEEGDELFHCAYLLGLLGLHSSIEGDGSEEFDANFDAILHETIEAENLTESDQEYILSLWKAVCENAK
ncbi:hypothetical protein MUS1_15080 [Marinomonas ushuaiensis DSM 15871]|uniref:YfcL protein n=1 Tax=Marinomonas ushuaiensis DSM 15871 TaxID=1122207 RepID=X7E3A8_9GAMM|nr:YfcL family protein [Marinomonas ushuaiensis]ETX10549.1 hypothetical protein MUS1_15080 [Marinomonas ushuaiensis DSM 15871]